MATITEPKVGDVWYRYEDRWCSVADPETGEHSYSTLEWSLQLFHVEKVTTGGVWLRCGEYREDADSWPIGERKWIGFHWNKKYACPSREEALVSLCARREREAQIYEARARAAREVILKVDMDRQRLLTMKGY